VHQKPQPANRIAFAGVAEITDQESGRHLTGDVSELSVHGCYVEIQRTLPIANIVVVKIFNESQCFEAIAQVIFVHQNVAMGLVFRDVSMQRRMILRGWLLRSPGPTQYANK
jgi:PilZ domain